MSGIFSYYMLFSEENIKKNKNNCIEMINENILTCFEDCLIMILVQRNSCNILGITPSRIFFFTKATLFGDIKIFCMALSRFSGIVSPKMRL